MDLFDYEMVSNALLEYQRMKTRLESIFTVLEATEKRLNNGICWTGEGASYVSQRYSELLENLSDLRIAMTNLNAYVSGVIENHRSSEMKMASLFGGFR